MGIRVELEMLAVLLFLTPVVIDGAVLTKCQLANNLQSAVPPTMQDRDTVIAKLVRQAEMYTNFTTNFTMQLTLPSDSANSRVARSPKKGSAKTPTKAPVKTPVKPAPAKPAPAKPAPVKPAPAFPSNATQSAKLQNTTATINITQMGPMMNHSTPVNSSQSNDQMGPTMNEATPDDSSNSDDQMDPPSNGSQKWTLYSVFLIPDAIACTSPNVSSLNVCNTTCNALLSDDITPATKCMLTIFNSTQSNNNATTGAASIMKSMLNKFMQSFPDLNCTTYLANCPKP